MWFYETLIQSQKIADQKMLSSRHEIISLTKLLQNYFLQSLSRQISFKNCFGIIKQKLFFSDFSAHVECSTANGSNSATCQPSCKFQSSRIFKTQPLWLKGVVRNYQSYRLSAVLLIACRSKEKVRQATSLRFLLNFALDATNSQRHLRVSCAL